MSMEISNAYSSYTGNYTKAVEKKENVRSSEKTTSADKTELTESTRKTSSDELAYLSKKYDGYSIVSANFQPGMRYGSKNTVNVAISPAFLKKMANNPELEEEYEKEIANMKACDERKVRNIEGQGDRIIAKGWAIDKDGNISSWTIGERGGNRPKVISPNEYGEKIRQQKAEKKKAEDKIAAKKKEKAEQKEALDEKRDASRAEQEALKERIDSDNRALLGDKYKGSEWFDVSDEIFAGEISKGAKDDLIGLNLDMKL